MASSGASTLTRPRRLLVAASVAASLGGLCLAGAASAAGPTIAITPNTGLGNGETVAITGSGFKPSQPGNVLECNNAPNEPTVALGSPVNNPLAIGCTPPTFSAASLTSTSATGAVSKTYTVATGTIGPPCGGSTDAVMTCPATDSAGQNPKTDAANYPCPPTPAQQAAGVTCTITFGDQSGESAQATVLFQGESTASPSTTAAPVTTAASAATASSGPALAYTGPGPQLWALLAGGLGLVLLSSILALAFRRAWRR